MKRLLILLGITMLLGLPGSQAADARRKHSIWYSPNSGISVIVRFGGASLSDPSVWLPPHFGEIPLSVYTPEGRFVASMTPTRDQFDPAMVAYVRAGDYIVVPDDPALINYATPVTVRFKEFTAVGIHIPPE